MIPLTDRQTEVLAFMFQFFDENDQLPTMAMIAGYFGWGSANNAQEICSVLHRKQMLEKNCLGKNKFSALAKQYREHIKRIKGQA